MASTITTSVVTGGSNSHATTVAEVNAFRSDFGSPGVTGAVANTAGVAPSTGSFAVNAQGSPAMFVDITAGNAYITATPSGQVSQLLRATMTATYTSYAISANASGSTKYDWIYLQVDATKANNPAADASDVTALYTSRSSSNVTDNGSPPTYGILLAVVTVANGASTISNSNITDSRTGASITTGSTNTTFFDFVASGCVWSGDSYGATLNATMTSGVVWINGKPLTVSGVASRAFTASKDTYVDLSDNGDGTAAINYDASTANNGASPALASGRVRIAIIVAGASSIAAVGSINQGQETKVLPIASSIPYAVTDLLGNLICPRDPNRKLLGYRQLTADVSTATTGSMVDITGLSVPFIVPANRKIKATLFGAIMSSGGPTYAAVAIREGSTGLNHATFSSLGASVEINIYVETLQSPSTGLHTYVASYAANSSTTTMKSAAVAYGNHGGFPFLKVELE